MTTEEEHQEKIRAIERECEINIAKQKAAKQIKFEQDITDGVRDREGNYLDPCGNVI